MGQEQTRAGVPLTERLVAEALAILRGAVMIVYPMGLPAYDPIRMELENREDLSGTQSSLQVRTLHSSYWRRQQPSRSES